MANNKTTKMDNYKTLLTIGEVAANAELTAFIQHEIELLEQKKNNRKSAAIKEEDKAYMDMIVEFLSGQAAPTQVRDIIKGIPAMREAVLSPQKVTPLMRKLEEADKVTAIVEKGVKKYSLV